MADDEAIYTHGHHESVLRSYRWRSAENSCGYLLPHLPDSGLLLDLGCGPGSISVDLARRLSGGAVVGVDASFDVLTVAADAGRGAGVANLVLTAAGAYSLPFPDDTFAVCHAHQVLQHLADPVAALAELRRVCAGDGVVGARDADFAAFSWYPEDRRLDRWLEIYRATAKANGGTPDAGRRLLAWAHAAGYAQVEASASTWCFATPAARAYWGEAWAERVLHSDFAARSLELGLTEPGELGEISAAWRSWVAEPDGWFTLVHGEVLCRP